MTAPGITLFCDPTLQPVMRSLDPLARDRIGAPVAVLSAPAGLLLAQIQHRARNDILFTLNAFMDQAVQLNLVKPGSRIDGWSNQLVLAVPGTQPLAAPDRPTLIRRLAKARVAVTNATDVSAGLDGRAILASSGLPLAGSFIGAADTGDVAFLLRSGAADVGLLYLTDVKAAGGLQVLAVLDDGASRMGYACAANAQAMSPNVQAFLGLIKGGEARARLQQAGLGAPS